MRYEANRRVETSARTFAIVEQLSLDDRVGVSSLADELGMSKGIVHNHLSTLRELGYVRKIGSEYQLSPQLLGLGLQARSNAQLYDVSHELCQEFASQLNTGVVLCQHTTSDCTVIDAYHLPPISNLAVGTELPLLQSLIGLVIQLTSNGDRSLSAGAGEYDTEELKQDLDATGYGTGPLSATHESYCVAFPIVAEDGECHGGIGIILTAEQRDQRLQQISEAASSLRERIERRFDSGWGGERSFATEKHSWIG